MSVCEPPPLPRQKTDASEEEDRELKAKQKVAVSHLLKPTHYMFLKILAKEIKVFLFVVIPVMKFLMCKKKSASTCTVYKMCN